jgi:Adenylate and Guanylate cyclase catalytic domain
LRGERSRFQLFGDTVNTAARMESTGVPDRIQLSQETADLILAAGKTGWIVAREDRVHAKGKGMLQTYFLDLEEKCDTSQGPSHDSTEEETTNNLTSFEDTEDFIELAQQAEAAKATPLGTSKNLRLVEWNSDILLRHLRQIVGQRAKLKLATRTPVNEDTFLQRKFGETVMDEVKEIIDLPGCASVTVIDDAHDVYMDPEVVAQLREYMKEIGGMYQDNPCKLYNLSTFYFL